MRRAKSAFFARRMGSGHAIHFDEFIVWLAMLTTQPGDATWRGNRPIH